VRKSLYLFSEQKKKRPPARSAAARQERRGGGGGVMSEGGSESDDPSVSDPLRGYGSVGRRARSGRNRDGGRGGN